MDRSEAMATFARVNQLDADRKGIGAEIEAKRAERTRLVVESGAEVAARRVAGEGAKGTARPTLALIAEIGAEIEVLEAAAPTIEAALDGSLAELSAAIDTLRAACRSAIEAEITARQRELRQVALELREVTARLLALGTLPGVASFALGAFETPHARAGGVDLLPDVAPDAKERDRLARAHGALFDSIAGAEVLLEQLGRESAERLRLRMLAQRDGGTR